MCNLSEGIWEDGVEEGIKQGIEQGVKQGIDKTVEVLRMHSKGHTALQISEITGIDLLKVEKIIHAIDG